jgi:signal transduction histidine kinase
MAQQELNESSNESNIYYLKRTNALEEGRNVVLKMVAQNASIEDILNTLCEKAQIYNAKIKCSILRLDQEDKTLHPIASISLPQAYCDALDGVNIGPGVGSCGTAAFSKERVIVENINTHPYWNQFKGLALSAGLQACWSEPIVGANGIIYGTFAIYYDQPTKPEPDDLQFIELSANLAAVVFDNNNNREELINANKRLSQTVDERNKQLEILNTELQNSLHHQKKAHSVTIDTEKMETTNSLISGFSHEISTPLGNALTAIEIAEDKIRELNIDFSSGNLTKSSFVDKVSRVNDVIMLNKNSLKRTIDLLSRFKEVNTSSENEKLSTFNMLLFFDELRNGTRTIIGDHKLSIDCQGFELSCAKYALFQVVINLVENSVIHGFKGVNEGVIHINVVDNIDEVLINYQDNGCGLGDVAPSKIFEPFYSSNRKEQSVGLGLNIVNNLVNQTLKGELSLVRSPVGIRYEIIIPKQV